jgi:predicted PurR-regulated permease PerM
MNKGARGNQQVALENDRSSEGANTIAFIVLIAAAGTFLYLIRVILLPFVFAGVVAYVCTPLIDCAARKMPFPRWTLALLVLLFLMAVGALVSYLGFPPLAREITRLGAHFQGSVQELASRLIGEGGFVLFGQPITPSAIAHDVSAALNDWFNQSGKVLTLMAWSFVAAFGFILTLVLLGYFLIDGPRVAAGLFWLVPPRRRDLVLRIYRRLDPMLWRYFVGVALIVLYASSAAYLGLGLVLGLRHALILALLTGLLEIIPVVGPAASAIIAGLVAVQQATSTWNIVAYIIYAAALRISIDQFFGPIVLGRAAYVRPVVVIFCFIAGGLLFGVVGVILAVPVALAIKITLGELYDDPQGKVST